MAERIIARGKPFTYTERHITDGIRHAQQQIAEYKVMLQSPDAEVRSAATRAIPTYEAALEYAQSRTPNQMIGELRQIYEDISELEGSHTDMEVIEDHLKTTYMPQIFHYQGLLNAGWIESAFQSVVTARLRGYNKQL